VIDTVCLLYLGVSPAPTVQRGRAKGFKMVEKKVDPIVTLTDEMKKRLMAEENDIARAEKSIKAMEEIGMDMTELKEKLEWSKTVRAMLLKEFT